MPNSVVPILLRPHLILFFYKELKSEIDVKHLDKNVKVCKFHPYSTIGRIIKLAIKNANKESKAAFFYVYFYQNPEEKKQLTGVFYQKERFKESSITFPTDITSFLNDYLEDLFRYTFVQKIKNVKEYTPKFEIETLIKDFMVYYELDEFGFNINSLRKLYHNQKKQPALSRFQNKSSNRVKNFQ